jgi:hypothetical protein
MMVAHSRRPRDPNRYVTERDPHVDKKLKSHSRFWAARVSILAVLPLLVLQLVFLADVQGWSVALSYGLIALVVPASIVGLLAFLATESYLRAKYLAGIRRFPWFTPIVATALLTFFHVGEWAKPVVIGNAEWCRVNQVIKWTTPKDGFFVLVLVGRGNVADHEFSSAYLNWSGDEPAGISDIDFKPIQFGWWDGYNHISADATPDELRKRLAPSGLSDDQLDSLTPAIWAVLQQANDGESVSSSTAKVDPVWDAPFGDEHVILGGVVWMVVLVMLFLTIGQLTLTKPEHKYAT